MTSEWTKNTFYYRAIGGKEFYIRCGDITKEKSDALVTAANSNLAGGGGVDAAIHNAGGPIIPSQLRQFKDGCPTGKAVVTEAGNLKAKMIIHAVGPVWMGGDKNEPELLKSAYRESLALAEKEGAKSILFPSISTGAYRYPIKKAALIAIKTIIGFLKTSKGLSAAGIITYSKDDLLAYQKAAAEVIDDSFN